MAFEEPCGPYAWLPAFCAHSGWTGAPTLVAVGHSFSFWFVQLTCIGDLTGQGSLCLAEWTPGPNLEKFTAGQRATISAPV